MLLICIDLNKANTKSPHRLVVRTSRRGRDNPGSTPGVDMGVDDEVRETFGRICAPVRATLIRITRHATCRFKLYVCMTVVAPP